MSIDPNAPAEAPKVVTESEWLSARKALLEKERELRHQMDAVSQMRRELPWVKVEKNYIFQTEDGPKTLSDLFEGRSQLIVYHFMFGPGATQGCTGCSFLCDHVDGSRKHFEHRDVKFVAVSRGKLEEFLPFKHRMGWTFDWVSSNGSPFNYDYNVSFTPEQIANGTGEYNYAPLTENHEDLHGLSVFAKDSNGTVYHTYSTYARGCDILSGAFNYMDMTPKGRNEQGTMNWVRHHDKYDNAQEKKSCCH